MSFPREQYYWDPQDRGLIHPTRCHVILDRQRSGRKIANTCVSSESGVFDRTLLFALRARVCESWRHDLRDRVLLRLHLLFLVEDGSPDDCSGQNV